MTNYEVVARRAIKYSYELRVTNGELRMTKRGGDKNSILKGRLQNAPYNVIKSD